MSEPNHCLISTTDCVTGLSASGSLSSSTYALPEIWEGLYFWARALFFTLTI